MDGMNLSRVRKQKAESGSMNVTFARGDKCTFPGIVSN